MREFSEGSGHRFSILTVVVVLLVMGAGFRSYAGAQEGGQQTAPVQTPSVGRQAYDGTANLPVHASPAVFEDRIPAEQLQFLKSYTGDAAKKLTKDKRFNALLEQITPRTEYHYGRDMSLSDTVDVMLHSGRVGVTLMKDRYVMVASSMGPYLSGRAFIWVDTEQGVGIGGVFFRPVNGEPTPTLAIFTKQLRVSELKMSQLPAEFVEAVRDWSAELKLRLILTQYFIPQSGYKYVLEHDEVPCKGAMERTPEETRTCVQRMLDAAEVDVEAAAFITRLHNAADAMIWRMNGVDAEQAEWLEKRKKSCETGAANVECWMQMTHARTDELIARRKQ